MGREKGWYIWHRRHWKPLIRRRIQCKAINTKNKHKDTCIHTLDISLTTFTTTPLSNHFYIYTPHLLFSLQNLPRTFSNNVLTELWLWLYSGWKILLSLEIRFWWVRAKRCFKVLTRIITEQILKQWFLLLS